MQLVVLCLPGFIPVQYFYQILSGFDADEVSDSASAICGGELRTPSPQGSPHNFTFGFSSCAYTGSDKPVFHELAEAKLSLFLQIGDLHYANCDTDGSAAIDQLIDAYSESLSSPRYGCANSTKQYQANLSVFRCFLQPAGFVQFVPCSLHVVRQTLLSPPPVSQAGCTP